MVPPVKKDGRRNRRDLGYSLKLRVSFKGLLDCEGELTALLLQETWDLVHQWIFYALHKEAPVPRNLN